MIEICSVVGSVVAIIGMATYGCGHQLHSWQSKGQWWPFVAILLAPLLVWGAYMTIQVAERPSALERKQALSALQLEMGWDEFNRPLNLTTAIP